MKAALFTFELPESKWGITHRVPLNLPVRANGEKLTPSTRVLLEKVFSFTRKRVEETKTGELVQEVNGAMFTYEQEKTELGRARSTVAAAFATLRDGGLIKKLDRDMEGTQYVYVGEPTGGKFYFVPLYLYTMRFGEEQRRLTSVEVHLLAYLMSECAYPANGAARRKGGIICGGVCKTSYKKLARVLHYSASSIRSAMDALLEGKLVYRPARSKGTNGAHLSAYEVNAGLYVYQKYRKRHRTQEEELQARREYYGAIREQAEERATRYRALAEQDGQYRKVGRMLGQIEVALAKAELAGELEKAALIQRDQKRYEAQRIAVLQRLGIDENDVRVQCNCDVCQDKGYLGAGKWCACYPGGAYIEKNGDEKATKQAKAPRQGELLLC